MRFLRFLDALLAKRLQGCFDMGGSGVKAVVSARMARIRSSGSKMEREFGAQLRKAGIPFRKQYRVLGKPDFVVLNERIAIFCDSRFWHGYRWGRRSSRDFKVNGEFWIRKIEGNRRRDSLVNRELRKQGWRVFRFWEHQISGNPRQCVLRVWTAIEERRRLLRSLPPRCEKAGSSKRHGAINPPAGERKKDCRLPRRRKARKSTV